MCRRLPLLSLVAATMIAACPAWGQDRASNAALLDSCARRVARQAAGRVPDGSLELVVDSTREGALLAAALYRPLAGRVSGAPALRLAAHVDEAATSYRKIGDSVARDVGFGATFSCSDVRTGVVRWAGTIAEHARDTMPCGFVASVDRPDFPAAHAADPCAGEPSFFSTIVEPVVLTLAAATIVVLLFTVRNQ